MSYQDLVIVIDHRTPTDAQPYYQVTMRHSALPVLSGPFRRERSEPVWTVSVQDLRQQYHAFLEMMHEIAEDTQATVPPNLEDLLTLGRQVTAILPKYTRRSLVEATILARRRGHSLRITIAVQQNALDVLAIPWELMVVPMSLDHDDTANNDFLLLDSRFSLVRQVVGVGRSQPAHFAQPLQFQAFAAQPAGFHIDTATTERALEAHAGWQPEQWYDGPDTLQMMHRRIRRAPPQILHILCHGSESHTQIEPRHDLIFANAAGHIRRASIFDLAPIVAQAPDHRLEILHACHGGAEQAERDRQTSESIALGLLRRGVPTVIAFQGEVAQQAASAFAGCLYDALAEGEPVERAVALSRAAMLTAEGTVDWSLPVIYEGYAHPEPRSFFNRAADRLDLAIQSPTVGRTLRRIGLALGSLLAVIGIARLLPLPWTPLQLSSDEITALIALWVGPGVLCPAIVATVYRGVRNDEQIDPDLRRMARYGQWMGAYLGYGMTAMLAYPIAGILYGLGVLALLPPVVLYGLVLSIVPLNIIGSYSVARGQMQSALVIGPEVEWTYGPGGLALLMTAAFLLMFGPFGLLWLVGLDDLLGSPSLVSFTLAALLIALALARGD